MADVVLQLEHVTKRFGEFTALHDLSLEVTRGEILTLLGPSGCGKTTTLRIIAGLESPDAGAIYFRDRPLVSVADGVFVPPDKRNMGMVFQSYAIWPHMTVFDNVAYPLRVRHVPGPEIRERVERVLALVGLTGYEQRPGPQLSGGQQQRVALARALVFEPGMLLMDEPFSNLDAKLREQMRGQLRLLLKKLQDLTVIFVTHDQAEALSLSDRIVVMHHGRIEQVGSPPHVYGSPATAFTRDFVGRTIVLPGTVDAMSGHGELRVRLRTVSGSVVVGSPCPGQQVTNGSEVCVCIRPEDVEVVAGTNGAVQPNELEGSVEALSFMGDHRECQVRISDADTLLLPVPRALELREGEAVRVRISARGAIVWPA